MPSSVKDRFTVDFEYLFFFSKKKKYYFETQYEDFANGSDAEYRKKLRAGKRYDLKKPYENNTPYAVQPRDKEFVEYRNLPDLKEFSKYINNARKEIGDTIDEVEEQFGNQSPHHWFSAESFPSVEDYKKLKSKLKLGNKYDKQMMEVFTKSSEKTSSIKGRNKRTVWSICPKPFKEAHFAVYPEELCETPIKAGCPEFVCKKCGKPKIPEYQSNRNMGEEKEKARLKDLKSKSQYGTGKVLSNDQTTGMQHRDIGPHGEVGMYNKTEFKGYKPSCSCGVGFTPGIVLDPFLGAGTTGLVALKQGKKFLGIELNKEYIGIAKKRLKPFLEQEKLKI